jgi:hypothetical protein
MSAMGRNRAKPAGATDLLNVELSRVATIPHSQPWASRMAVGMHKNPPFQKD